MTKLFIAGTDTEVGKTYVSVGLLHGFNQLGLSTIGLKPIASGSFKKNNILYNADSLSLQKAASIKLTQNQITPFAFEPAIAPHIAAKLVHIKLSIQNLNDTMHPCLSMASDIKVIEGCGGWYIPLNDKETFADFVTTQKLKVILVIGLRVGCINHSLLTLRAMQRDGAEVIGWIANIISPSMENKEENIETLKSWLPIPCFGVIRYEEKPESCIDMKMIFHAIKVNAKG